MVGVPVAGVDVAVGRWALTVVWVEVGVKTGDNVGVVVTTLVASGAGDGAADRLAPHNSVDKRQAKTAMNKLTQEKMVIDLNWWISGFLFNNCLPFLCTHDSTTLRGW